VNKPLMIGCVTVLAVIGAFVVGCRVETVGDPDKPIKIEAHITVDIRQLKDTAVDIEDMVSGDKPAPQASLRSVPEFIFSVFDIDNACAAGSMSLKFSTPETDRAINARRNRFGDLQNYKNQGLVGEGNKGYVVQLGGGGNVKALVDTENNDRSIIYHAIVEQNGMASSDIAIVQKTFAEVQREKASNGQKIQLGSGQWITK